MAKKFYTQFNMDSQETEIMCIDDVANTTSGISLSFHDPKSVTKQHEVERIVHFVNENIKNG
jgi:hypothetical protein